MRNPNSKRRIVPSNPWYYKLPIRCQSTIKHSTKQSISTPSLPSIHLSIHPSFLPPFLPPPHHTRDTTRRQKKKGAIQQQPPPQLQSQLHDVQQCPQQSKHPQHAEKHSPIPRSMPAKQVSRKCRQSGVAVSAAPTFQGVLGIAVVESSSVVMVGGSGAAAAAAAADIGGWGAYILVVGGWEGEDGDGEERRGSFNTVE
ncbi:hypothetical protein L873DRAFT_265675 [Choiromyces venosus 120613-1]|uniref:Uncharacterized protein n=1 Tax=Choiromyces venosus 120613-1 TaxID=1336337 RepID=A0A3N4JDF4_9PEZI|nr:hypothetical protein L873DRAFT_265675 [Choiromyces venosus 120613-1]